MNNKIKKILYPNIFIILVLVVLSFVLLYIVFNKHLDYRVFGYVVYVVSAYTLIVSILKIINVCIEYKKIKEDNKYLFKNEFLNNCFNDKIYRSHVFTICSFLFDFLYFIFRMYIGIFYDSFWFVLIALYYLGLSLLRVYVLIQSRRKINNYKLYLHTTFLLFPLNIVLLNVIILVVKNNETYIYQGYIIYLIAFYTFYILTLSIINYIKYKNHTNLIFSISKTISFICSLVSIFTLQTAMISTFSNDVEFRLIMNTFTGITVLIFIIVIQIRLLINYKKYSKIEKIKGI